MTKRINLKNSNKKLSIVIHHWKKSHYDNDFYKNCCFLWWLLNEIKGSPLVKVYHFYLWKRTETYHFTEIWKTAKHVFIQFYFYVICLRQFCPICHRGTRNRWEDCTASKFSNRRSNKILQINTIWCKKLTNIIWGRINVKLPFIWLK